jgi:hypothetical protein
LVLPVSATFRVGWIWVGASRDVASGGEEGIGAGWGGSSSEIDGADDGGTGKQVVLVSSAGEEPLKGRWTEWGPSSFYVDYWCSRPAARGPSAGYQLRSVL